MNPRGVSLVATTTTTNRQHAERTTLRLQWKAAVRSLSIALGMAQRSGIEGAELEALQVLDLAQQTARLSKKNPGATS
jgi:hypothetical protein